MLAALNQRAAERGAGVLLSGDGADELLGSPFFLTGALSPAGAIRFLADMHNQAGAAQLAYETVSWIADRWLPASARSWLFFWQRHRWQRARPSQMLAAPYEHMTRGWQIAWCCDLSSFAARHLTSWPQHDLWAMIYPHDAVRGEGRVPERPPFLHEPFVEYALALDPSVRFDPLASSPYRRFKGLVAKLLPERVRDDCTFFAAKQTSIRLYENDHNHLFPQACIEGGSPSCSEVPEPWNALEIAHFSDRDETPRSRSEVLRARVVLRFSPAQQRIPAGTGDWRRQRLADRCRRRSLKRQDVRLAWSPVERREAHSSTRQPGPRSDAIASLATKVCRRSTVN